MSGVNTIISCTTAIGTTAKTATVPKGFTLDSGVSFLIKFINGNTATSPTLTLTPEGGSALTAKSLVGTSGHILTANIIYTCYYNGTNFTIDNNCTSHMNNKNNPHNVTKTSVGLSSVVNRGLDSSASTTSTNYIQNNVATSIANGVICTSSPNSYPKTVSLSGFSLFNGATVRVLFQHGHNTLNVNSRGPTLDVNSTGAKDIVVRRNNKFYAPVSHTGYWDGATTTSTRMWDSYVTFELMYIAGTQNVYNPLDDTILSSQNGVWLIMGNPVVNSYFSNDSGYTVYANGLIEQWLRSATIPSEGTILQFPMSFSTTNYVVAESRYGENIHDATGHFTKYTYGIKINPENAHVTDFIFIGY
jgi:hypothetical protein